MMPDLLQSSGPSAQFDLWKTAIGLIIVLFASFVGVEIRLGNDDDEQ